MRPVPALAALLVVALLWPAWIGLRGGRSDGVPPATPADIRALYLPPATRSPADVPAIALRPGQTLLPLVIPIDPWAGRTDTADFPLTFTVTDAAEDRLLWTLTTPASAAWDERGRFVSVAVDGTKLVRGACLLRVAGPDGAVLMEGRFEVR
jgi:hypothetical protein